MGAPCLPRDEPRGWSGNVARRRQLQPGRQGGVAPSLHSRSRRPPMKSVLLWIAGVPLVVVVLLNVFGVL